MNYQANDDLVDALKKEQGYLCAYCMRRIPCKDILYQKDGKDIITKEGHRVEHILSRDNHSDKELDYSNMVICCPGHIGAEKHCDRLKDSNDITFSPLDIRFINTIKYKPTGEIESSNSLWNSEMNNILNLNTPLLVKNRAETLLGVIQVINAKSKGWKRSVLEKYLENILRCTKPMIKNGNIIPIAE